MSEKDGGDGFGSGDEDDFGDFAAPDDAPERAVHEIVPATRSDAQAPAPRCAAALAADDGSGSTQDDLQAFLASALAALPKDDTKPRAVDRSDSVAPGDDPAPWLATLEAASAAPAPAGAAVRVFEASLASLLDMMGLRDAASVVTKASSAAHAASAPTLAGASAGDDARSAAPAQAPSPSAVAAAEGGSSSAGALAASVLISPSGGSMEADHPRSHEPGGPTAEPSGGSPGATLGGSPFGAADALRAGAALVPRPPSPPPPPGSPANQFPFLNYVTLPHVTTLACVWFARAAAPCSGFS